MSITQGMLGIRPATVVTLVICFAGCKVVASSLRIRGGSDSGVSGKSRIVCEGEETYVAGEGGEEAGPVNQTSPLTPVWSELKPKL